MPTGRNVKKVESSRRVGKARSGYNKGTIRCDLRYLVVSKDVRRHRLISISYISQRPVTAEVASSSLVVPAIFSRSAGSIVVACHSPLLCLCCRNALVSGHASRLEKPHCKRPGDSARETTPKGNMYPCRPCARVPGRWQNS